MIRNNLAQHLGEVFNEFWYLTNLQIAETHPPLTGLSQLPKPPTSADFVTHHHYIIHPGSCSFGDGTRMIYNVKSSLKMMPCIGGPLLNTLEPWHQQIWRRVFLKKPYSHHQEAPEWFMIRTLFRPFHPFPSWPNIDQHRWLRVPRSLFLPPPNPKVYQPGSGTQPTWNTRHIWIWGNSLSWDDLINDIIGIFPWIVLLQIPYNVKWYNLKLCFLHQSKHTPIYPQFFSHHAVFQNPFPTQWPRALLANAISFFALMASMVGINLLGSEDVCGERCQVMLPRVVCSCGVFCLSVFDLEWRNSGISKGWDSASWI